MVLNMSTIYAILLYLCCLRSLSAQILVNVNLGEDVTLKCPNIDDNTVTLWSRYELYCPQIIVERTLDEAPEPDDNENGRFPVISDNTALFIIIKNIRYADQGTYRCNLLHDISLVSEYNLVVRSGSKNDQKLIKEYNSTALECLPNSSIDPAQQIIWSRENDESFTLEGNILELRNVSRKDAGTYRCSYRRENGTTKIKEIDLVVKYGPIVRDFGISENKSQPSSCPVEEISVPKIIINDTDALLIDYPKFNVTWREFDKELKCLVEAYPEPSIFWYKDDTRLINNMHYRIAHRKRNATFTESYLKMIWSDETNNGTYKCFASNYISNTTSRDITFIRDKTKVGNSANFETAATTFVVIGCILFQNFL